MWFILVFSLALKYFKKRQEIWGASRTVWCRSQWVKGDIMPRQSSHRPSTFIATEWAIVQSEIDNLITKGVIVPSSPEKGDFVSTIFLCPKKEGSHHTILNLKQFNKFLEYHHFTISSLFDIARSVKESASVNVAELVGLHNGTVLIPTYDWFTYLGNFFKKLPNIKFFYHFRFHRAFPGTVFCKEYWNSQERAVNLLRNGTTLEPGILPPTVSPSGISRERAEYLHKEICEFCWEGTKDLVAPPVPQ